MDFSSSNASVTTCTSEQLKTQGATDVLLAQVGSRKKSDDSKSLQETPVGLNFSFMTTVSVKLESYRCVYWNFSEP